MKALLDAILDDNPVRVSQLIANAPDLVTRQAKDSVFYDTGIFHWFYVGDTALHLAAAGYRNDIVKMLLAAGADANAATNHRRGTPLHYAADGYITGPAWDETKQVKTIRLLLAAGADLHVRDKNGASALHRAVRTRCAAAVRYLVDAGADPAGRNLSGSTAFHLAVQNTGRGGSGADVAIAAQREIIEEFLARGVSPHMKDGKGRSVVESATSSWIRSLLVR